jgi:hypothetical protein
MLPKNAKSSFAKQLEEVFSTFLPTIKNANLIWQTVENMLLLCQSLKYSKEEYKSISWSQKQTQLQMKLGKRDI